MTKWVDNHKWVAGLLVALATSIVWAFSTFATVGYVDAKHADVKEDVTEIKGDVKDIKKMMMRGR